MNTSDNNVIYVLFNEHSKLIKDKFFFNYINAKDRADYLNKRFPDTCKYRVIKLHEDEQDGRDPVFDYDSGWQHSND